MKFSLFANYKNQPLSQLLADLESSLNGLADSEAQVRLEIFGKNQPPQKKKAAPIIRFLNNFKNPLILILLIAATISGLAGESRSSVIIITIVVLSVGLNFYQEHRSSKAAEKLAKKLSLTAAVIRNDEKKEIFAKFIVPGDVVFLSAGDIVPADGRVIQADDFFVNEASLTGESFPVEKVAGNSDDINNQVIYAGTNVISGSARYVVARTGINTEFGKIAVKITEPLEANAFEVGVKNFGTMIVKVTIFIVLIIFLINAILKHDILQSFIFSIAVAVGLTPELLPMILSINMARGAVKMSKKGVIVKRLNAIPDFGSMDILGTDKTGTITEGRITMVKHVDIYGQTSDMVLRYAYINASFETGLKSPVELSILDFKNITIPEIKKVDEIPYDFIRKRMSVVVEENGNRYMVTKGAPEEVFEISHYYFAGLHSLTLDETIKKQCQKLYDDLSSQGFRVLAVAYKDVYDGRTVYPMSEESNMVLAGFIAFYDPPKASAKETIEFMKKYGIEIKILTGDSALVTQKICHDLDIEIKGIMIGDEIGKLTNDALRIKALQSNIFARCSPQQKERIISVLRKGGQVVGYLGDGINDAPSLKTADVGISVNNAVDVARETADIILLEKELKVLMDGVIEGRRTFGNTMKYMMMGLSSNFGNMFSLIGASLFIPFLPMQPTQILLNNFLYDCSQVTIPLDNVDREYLMKPKHWNMNFIRNFMYVFGPISSLFDFITFFTFYSVFRLSETGFQTAWFLESLATQTLVIYVIRSRHFSFVSSRPSIFLIATTVGAVLAGVFFATTALGHYFGFTPLPLRFVGIIFSITLIYLIMVEIGKYLFYKKFSKF